ncbi:MAG: helix-turn-helix transcriptional regulator [bacterium]|nr:helix-turn-helix transcriptional regulator [bacterium]
MDLSHALDLSFFRFSGMVIPNQKPPQDCLSALRRGGDLKRIEGMNHSHDVAKAVQQAVTSTREQIALDLQRVSSAVQVALEYISENLLLPDLSVDRLVRTYKLTRTARRLFRAELAVSPKQYLIRCRMETAGWLLRNTELDIWAIASSLGYSRPRNFSRDFRHWSGQTPTNYRKEKGVENRVPIRSERFFLLLWWHAVVRALNPERAQRLISWVEKLLPAAPAIMIQIQDGSNAERMAETVWRALRSQPPEEQRNLLRYSIRCASPALFHLLGEKSLEEGRVDRQRGIELAELSIDSLEANEALLGDAAADLRALGWARLANARRLAHDFLGAETDIARAEKEWDAPRPLRNHAIEGEICDLKASLRIVQRRFLQAIALLDRSIGLCRVFGRPEVLVRSLIQRAKIYDFRCEHDKAVLDLKEAIQVLKTNKNPYLQLIAWSNLATSQVWAGKYEEALGALPRVKALCAEFGDASKHHQVEWLEGLAKQGLDELETAEDLLKKARCGFTELNEPDYAAAVSLDLAILYMQQGRFESVLILTSQAIQFFDAHIIHPDAVAARNLLREAIAANQFTTDILSQARACRDSLRRDPVPSE